MEKKNVYVVPHSHWDAEWYFTCEDSHILLVENMTYLMDMLEDHPEFPSYSFDGLSIVLDDFMEICPEQKNRLMRLIKERRIFVGPWYTQTDTLLVRSESVVRNLMYGIKKANEFGHCMNIGYLPDVFGQHAYLPSIFQDLGITYSVLQRGLYTEQIQENLNFLWKSPNGKTLPTNCLYYGYGPGKFIASNEDYVKHRLLPILDNLSKMNQQTNRLLLPSGGDQVLANLTFPITVKELNAFDLDYQFHMSNYEDYMRDTWEETKFTNVIEGELIACQKSRIHRTCHSTRYDMKLQTYTTEHLLLDQLEPLAVIADELEINYPKEFFALMWKRVFTSHAHNGIEASNADQVNANVKNRLASVERSALSMINLLKKKIAIQVANKLHDNHLFLVFHCDVKKGNALIEGVLFTNTSSFALFDGDKEIVYNVVNQTCLDGGQRVVVTAQGEKLEKVDDYYRTEILMEVDPQTALGYKTYRIVEKETEKEWMHTNCTTIENDQYCITLEKESLTLKDKKNDIVLSDFITFVDCADYGDEFDFAPLENDVEKRTCKFEYLHGETHALFSKMIVKSTLLIPCDLDHRIARNGEKPLEIITTLELRKDDRLLHISHDIENTMKDHRVRVHIASALQNLTHSYADQGYSIIKRDSSNAYLSNWKELGFVEKPMPIYTMENIVYIKDHRVFEGVLTKGIKEYEVLCEEQCIALTLYRSVGLLGRDNTAWRPGRASGINNKVVETPDAQMIGKLHFDYAVWLDCDVDSQNIYSQIDKYRGRDLTYQLQQLNTFEERLERFSIPLTNLETSPQHQLFELTNEHVFMSMCKPGEHRGEYVLRLFNPTDCTQLVNLQNTNSIYRCTMMEDCMETIHGIITMLPKDYITIKVIR